MRYQLLIVTTGDVWLPSKWFDVPSSGEVFEVIEERFRKTDAMCLMMGHNMTAMLDHSNLWMVATPGRLICTDGQVCDQFCDLKPRQFGHKRTKCTSSDTMN